MSRRCYRRHGRGGLSAALDDTAHIASSFDPVGALSTGAIGFAFFHTVLPLCMMAWTAEHKASPKGPAAAALAIMLDQIMWHRFILACQWAGIAILVVCSAIAVWKLLDRAEPHDEDVTFLGFFSKSVSRMIGN